MTLRRYPAYKDSGVEWLGEVPEHWDVKRLKYAVRLLTEKTDRREHPVGLENIESWTGIFVPTDSEFQSDGVAFECGDILFGKLRPYLAKVLLAEQRGEAVGDFHVLRAQPGTVSHFAAYLIRNRDFIVIVDSSTYGAKMPRVGWDFMAALNLPMPPIEEQTTIVAFLDRETAKIDTLIAEQRNLIELLKEKRQAVISHAVTKGLKPDVSMKDSGVEWLGEVPEHWNLTRIGSVFLQVQDAGKDDLPVLTVSIHHGVSDREFDDDEMDRKVSRIEDRSKYKAVEPGDLVYNMMRAWQGGFGTVQVEGLVSPAYVVARPTKNLKTDFIEKVLRTPKAVEEMRRHSVGVTDFRLRLYWEDFKNIRIGLPPVLEQTLILNDIQVQVGRFDSLVAEAKKTIELLHERRSALISAAVTGKVDVRDRVASEAA